MSRSFVGWLAALAVVLLTGCAHPINLNSDVAKLMASGVSKVDRKVGLLLTDDQRKFEQVTPGGGGDKVSYQPYRDLESGLYVALSENFTGVTRLADANDPKLKTDGLSYVVVPTLSTTSFSPSIFTWPPTVFTLEIHLSFNDLQNKPVTQVRVQGEGRAEFDEFKGDFSLSAKRAAEDALKKLVQAIADASARLK